MTNKENKWWCHICGKEDDFENLPFGYLGNFHPLCEGCADDVLFNKDHQDHQRLTYHKAVGDIVRKQTLRSRKISIAVCAKSVSQRLRIGVGA